MGPPKQNRQSIMIRLRRCELLEDSLVCSVSRTFARLRMMQAIEPTIPKLAAIIILISTSQRM